VISSYMVFCCRCCSLRFCRRRQCDERITWPSSWQRLRRIVTTSSRYDFRNICL